MTLTLDLRMAPNGKSMLGTCREIPEVMAIGIGPIDTLRSLIGCIGTLWEGEDDERTAG